MRTLCVVLISGALGLLAQPARGQSSTTYGYKYVADQIAYTAPVNSDVTISLYLQETNSDHSTHSLLVNEHGLTSAGVQVIFTSGDPSATISAATANNGSVPTSFDDAGNTATSTPTGASISESTDPPPFGSDTSGVEPGAQSNGVSKVFLGTVKIHTGPAPSTVSTFTIGTNDGLVGATFTSDNNYNLDNTSYPFNPAGAASLYGDALPSTFTVTTTATPESASLSLLLLLCPFMSRGFNRRV